MTVEPYLFFEGRCEEALTFYREALGAEVTMLMRYRDNPTPAQGDGCANGSAGGPTPDMVMHAALRVGGTQVMASDGLGSGQPRFQGVALSISAADVAEAQRLFGGLAAGGQVQAPLGPTFFSPAFGMVVDRFGVSWMVVVPAQGL